MTDPIQALLDAAANPKLTPGPWVAKPFHEGDPPAKKGVPIFQGNNAADRELMCAARNGLRAVFEEWLRYGHHLWECPNHRHWVGYMDQKCTCGWSARRQQIADYLERTKAESEFSSFQTKRVKGPIDI